MSDEFWTVADLHLGHQHVSNLRGFETTQAHDAQIMENLDDVPDESTLICLGDISVRQDSYALKMLGEFKREKNLTMVLLPGNHNLVHPMFGIESVRKWTPQYREVFDVISLDLHVRIDRWHVFLTHIPRATGKDPVPDPHQTEKLARWAARPGFDCTVHGHTHSEVAVLPKNVNVSLEAFGLRPVSPEKLSELVNSATRLKNS